MNFNPGLPNQASFDMAFELANVYEFYSSASRSPDCFHQQLTQGLMTLGPESTFRNLIGESTGQVAGPAGLFAVAPRVPSVVRVFGERGTPSLAGLGGIITDPARLLGPAEVPITNPARLLGTASEDRLSQQRTATTTRKRLEAL
jgi:hypothetical protein